MSAPVNFYGTQGSTRTFPTELYEETTLFDPLTTTENDKEIFEILSEIYSIIITLDSIEKSFLKDNINSTQYTNIVNKLLKQYNVYLNNDKIMETFVNLETFVKRFEIVASNAIIRLNKGIPMTLEHGISDDKEDGGDLDKVSNEDETDKNEIISGIGKKKNSGINGKYIAEATGNFITLIDALKLNYRAKDQLHPLLADLLLSINKLNVQNLPHRQKLVEWIIKLNKLKVDDVLSDNEIRELIYDLEMSYKSFYTLLE